MRSGRRVALIAFMATFPAWMPLARHLGRSGAITTPAPAITVPQQPTTPLRPVPPPSTVGPASALDDDQPEAQSETDLYGNSVDEAVAEYGLDAAGSLYELHAPQVELPRLGSPKS